jgi:hypothetical protein
MITLSSEWVNGCHMSSHLSYSLLMHLWLSQGPALPELTHPAKDGPIQIILGFPLSGILLAPNKTSELLSGATVAS